MKTFLTHMIASAALVSSAQVSDASSAQFDKFIYITVAPERTRLTEAQPLSVIHCSEGNSLGNAEMVDDAGPAETSPLWAIKEEKWFAGAVARLAKLKFEGNRDLPEELRKVADNALQDGRALLSQLSRAGLQSRPAMGLDSDGSLSLYVSTGDFSADISVFGDGTYSFSAKRSSERAFLWEGSLGGPIPLKLTLMLA